jgi:Mn2+/Fe2+ NRAMP family transporter
VTGAGHARLIFERFGRRWGAFALGDLLALSLLSIVTEFIGVDLALGYFGISRYVSVPVAALALVAVTAGGSFRRWERAMYVLVAVNLTVIPLALLSHPRAGEVAQAVVPGLRGELNVKGVLFVIALVGATVSPAQLFFQQSNVVDKRITARWLSYERIDTLLGTLLFAVGATALVIACTYAFNGTSLHGAFVDVGGVTRGLERQLGAPAGAIFALVLLNGSILGTVVVTLASSYALGDVLGLKHSLHRRWHDARVFYGTFAAFVALAAGIVLVPHAPLGLVTTAVQALAGLLLPSATVFLLLLCNDGAVLGPWRNPPWLNAIATVIVGVLLVLSALLTLTTLLPDVHVASVALVLITALAVGLVCLAVTSAHNRGRRMPRIGRVGWERATWTMPPIESLSPPVRSRARVIGLVVLRLYISLAALLLVIKVVRLAIA